MGYPIDSIKYVTQKICEVFNGNNDDSDDCAWNEYPWNIYLKVFVP